MILEQWVLTLTELPLPIVVGAVSAWFAVLYLGFATLAELSRSRLLPALGIGAVLDPRPLRPRQIQRELRLSLTSVLVFGLLSVPLVLALRADWVRFTYQPEWPVILLDVVLIFFWNELHFYTCHRLLHRPWLMKRVHSLHHLSKVPTPYSTYAFHWFEALMLGSVMLTGMLLHDFHILAMMLLPLLSIAGNALGHFNYDLVPSASERHLLRMTHRHGLHHSRGSQNYGFLLPFMDRIFRSELGLAPTDEQTAAANEPNLRLPALVTGTLSKWFLGGLVLGGGGLAYAVTNRLHWIHPTPIQPALVDRLVPHLPASAWIYASYPVLFIVVFALERNLLRINRFLISVVALNIASELVFILFPTTIDRQPFIVHPTIAEGGHSLLAWIQHVDTPFNCLPSMHVSTSFLSALFAWYGRRRLRWVYMLWAVAISFSTLTTKQHLFADVLSGAVLAAYIYWFCFTQIAVAPRGRRSEA